MTAAASRRPLHVGRIVVYALLLMASVVYLTPVLVQLVTGLKSFQEVSLSRMWRLPTSLSFASFVKAWSGAYQGLGGLSANFMNSVYLAVPATLISAALGSMNGYVLAKWKFRGANILFPMLLFGMFIPYQSILIPLVRVLQNMHLYGTRGGLIFVHIVYGIPITTLIFRNYYAAIPDELIEAAKIDGAGILGIYAAILFPLSLPGFVVVMIWQFTSVWNDFLFAVIITSKPSLQPITVALNKFIGQYGTEWNNLMAVSTIAALPIILIFTSLQRFIVGGLTMGAVNE